MGEFELIQRHFVPLAKHFSGSLNLSDDAAIVNIPSGYDLVVTTDAISEAVHFIGTEDPALIARKLLRTNLSDLAGMGAAPLCYFLSIALPSPLSEDYIARFASGLAHDQALFSIHLAGGDTITTKGSPTFSMTAHGLVPSGTALRRSGAKPGDIVYVSGTLGDAALGLHAIQKSGFGTHAYLEDRYLLPQPRLLLGEQLRGMATSCMDISDGLLQDMGHICATSGVGADIHREKLPLSAEAHSMLTISPELWPLIYSGGDDYELLFTLPPHVAPIAGTTCIGHITDGNKVRLANVGKEIPVTRSGYSHG